MDLVEDLADPVVPVVAACAALGLSRATVYRVTCLDLPPMAHQRAWLDKMKVSRAVDLKSMRNGKRVKVAGWVIVRQRPGTAKGFVFLSLEDETGIANIIVTPKLFETYRLALVDYPFLLIEGALQHQDNVVSVKAKRVEPLNIKIESAGSHDFH